MKVLFVDDEQFVLDGLKRVLRGMQNEWEMVFASSGSEALKIMADTTCDVIVSDMRMPGMSGYELLEKVRELHPDTMRFVLSGQTDRDTMLRSANSAHQFLSKPCDPGQLMQAVSRAGELMKTLDSRELRMLVTKLRSVPTLPAMYHQVVEEINKSEPSLARISQIVEQDVGMTAKILQMVNSAFFGSPRRAMSAGDAATLLGLDTLKALITAVHVFGQFPDNLQSTFDLGAFERHSLKTGAIARDIARKEAIGQDAVSRAFTAGILHDVGAVVLAAGLPKAYDGAVKSATKYGQPLELWESKLMGANHAELGGYLLGLWGFSSEIVEAVTFHAAPARCPVMGLTLVDIVHAAAGIEECIAKQGGFLPESCDIEHFDRKHLTHRLSAWRQEAESRQVAPLRAEEEVAA